MSRNPRHRPRKPQRLPGGEGGELRGLSGDPHPDKDEPGARTMVGRGLGLDDRDIPGGLPHLVNPESPASKTIPKEPRPLFDGLNAHGVEDPDPELGYTPTPTDVKPGPRSAPVPPEWDDAVPVRLVEKSPGRHLITAFYGDGPMTVAVNADPVRIIERDPERVNAYITNEMFTSGAQFQAQNTAAAPAANHTICSVGTATIVPGIYAIQWSVGLDGTLSASDIDNFVLQANGATIAFSDNPDVTGEWEQPTVTVVIPNTTNVVAIKSGSTAATTGSVYSASFIMTPIAAQVCGLRVGTYEDVAEGRGLFIPGGAGPVRVRTQDALWAAPDPNSPVAVKFSWAVETQVPAATG